MSKKIVALILSVSMIFGLCACGAKEEPSADNKKRETDEVSGEEAEVSNFNATGYPIVNEPVTITVLHKRNTSAAGEYATNEAFNYLQELTGIKLEFIGVDQTEFSEKLGLMLASDELPDIIWGVGMGLTDSDLAKYVKAGTIVDLAPYIESYGENIKYYMENFEGFSQGITLPDGTIVSLPCINMNVDSTGKCAVSSFDFYQPWLDDLGLEAPANTDELYKVLKAFKEKDPNGNGIQDEIPFAAPSVNQTYELFSLFGVIVQKDNYAYCDGDEVKFSPFMPEFKEGLEYIAKLFQEGLIDPEMYMDDYSNVLARGSGDAPVIGCSITNASHYIVGEAYNKNMIAIDIPFSEDCDPVWLNRVMVMEHAFLMTKACEYPETVICLMDYLFSEDGARLYWMGPEETYTWNDDGTWNWNLKDGETEDELRARATMQPQGAFAAAYCNDWFKQNSGAEALVNARRVQYGTDYADILQNVIPSGLTYDAEVEDDVAILAADLNTYVNNSIAQFISGELDIEADWDAFVNQCESLGAEEYIGYVQDAYDNYLSM